MSPCKYDLIVQIHLTLINFFKKKKKEKGTNITAVRHLCEAMKHRGQRMVNHFHSNLIT